MGAHRRVADPRRRAGSFILFVDGLQHQVIGYIAPQIAKNWAFARRLGWILAADKIGCCSAISSSRRVGYSAISASRSGASFCSPNGAVHHMAATTIELFVFGF